MDRQHGRKRPVGVCGDAKIMSRATITGRDPSVAQVRGAGGGRWFWLAVVVACVAGFPAAQAQSSGAVADASGGPTVLATARDDLNAPLPELPVAGGRLEDGAAGVPQAQACLVEPFQVSEIGSPSPGIVETIAVHRGDVVTEGQTLAVMNTQVDEATLKLRQAEAAYLSRVAGRNAELFKRKLLPAGDYDELTSRSRQAQLQVALQRAILAEREIKSPYVGVVAERYVGPGDRVNDNKLLRLAQLDPLLIRVVVPESAYGRIRQGDIAFVKVNPVIHAEILKAEVWRIDRVMDAASGTFTVLLKMENPDHAIPAGIRCAIRFAG